MSNRTDWLITTTWMLSHAVSLFLIILRVADGSPISDWPWVLILLPFIFDGLFVLLIIIVICTLYVLSKRYKRK